jgi:hypothetical protein
MHVFSKQRIAEDWQACKEAHTAAKEQVELARGWMPSAAHPWLRHLADLAGTFEAVHGIEFDPNVPPKVSEAA